MLEDKREQWLSLNGSFGMLACLMKAIDTKEITSIEDLRKKLLSGMEDLNEEMTKLESEITH